jgi:hypothetical protein
MSSKFFYYIGPFLVCIIATENNLIEKESHIRTCVNDKCKLYKKDFQTIITGTLVYGRKFCPECGNSSDLYTEKYKAPKFYAYDVCSKVDEKFIPVEVENYDDIGFDKKEFNINIFIPNVKIDGINRKCNFNENDEPICVILNDGQEYYEKETTSNVLSKEIEDIKSYYDNVFIHWGIIKYCL